jgi:hypothetical protein
MPRCFRMQTIMQQRLAVNDNFRHNNVKIYAKNTQKTNLASSTHLF